VSSFSAVPAPTAILVAETIVESPVSSVAFTGLLETSGLYRLEFNSVIPETNAVYPLVRVERGASGFFDSGVSDYDTKYNIHIYGAGSGSGDLGGTAFRVGDMNNSANSPGNIVEECGLSGSMSWSPEMTWPIAMINTVYRRDAGANISYAKNHGQRDAVGTYTGLEFTFHLGNILSGKLRVWHIPTGVLGS
jgi:hypothetical protein